MSEVIGVVITAVALLITFGSLAAAGLPLLTALLSVGISMVSITALGNVFGLSSTVGELAMMLGLAVGIDYSLFIVSRKRAEREKGHSPQEAAGLAAGTAGSAVVFAGLTVVIALTVVPVLLGFWPDAVLARHARKGCGHVSAAATDVSARARRAAQSKGRPTWAPAGPGSSCGAPCPCWSPRSSAWARSPCLRWI